MLRIVDGMCHNVEDHHRLLSSCSDEFISDRVDGMCPNVEDR